jgi:acetyltransferase
MAMVAELKEESRRRITGIGRLIIQPDFRSGEYAVLVHEEYQGKGLGYKLVDLIIGIAQDKGLEEIYGKVLTENERMLKLAIKLGFQYKLMDSGLIEVRLALK